MELNPTNSNLYENLKKQSKPYRLFITKIRNDWSFVLSSMLAFHFFIALLPMAIVLFGILGLILGNNLNLQNQIRSQIITSFPPKANETLNEIINLAFQKLHHDAKLILIFGIFFAILGCLRFFVAIDSALTIIHRVEERKFLQKYFLAGKMLILFLILIPLMISTSSIPSILFHNISNEGGRFLRDSLGFLISLFVTFLLFEIIYYLIPNKKLKFKQTWCGAIIAAISIQLFIILFRIYARKSLTSYTTQIGLIIILILFLFVFAIMLIIGAQINAFFFEHIQPLPSPLGTFISQLIGNYQRNIRGIS